MGAEETHEEDLPMSNVGPLHLFLPTNNLALNNNFTILVNNLVKMKTSNAIHAEDLDIHLGHAEDEAIETKEEVDAEIAITTEEDLSIPTSQTDLTAKMMNIEAHGNSERCE